MNGNQFQPLTVLKTPSSPRYAFVSSLRLRRQSTDFKRIRANRADDSKKRVQRHIQSVQPYEYTIYLAPDKDTENPTFDAPTFEQIKSVYPTGTSNPSQTVSLQPDILRAIHSIQKNNQISHTDYFHQRSCSPCAYLPAIQTSSPKISTNNQISTVVANSNPLHSCSPLSQNIPLPSTDSTKSPSICHCPQFTANSSISTVSMPSKTVPTTAQQQTITPMIKAPYPVHSETSSIPSLPTTTLSSIVTATTPAPLVLTTTSSPNPTLHELCQNHSKTGKCNVMIKKAIILFNGDQNTANLSSIVNAFTKLNDNDSDFEDLQENDDVTILDGKELLLSISNKSPSIKSKIFDLLGKVHHELQIANQRNSSSICDDDYSKSDNDEIEPNKEDGKKTRDSNEQNVTECETGKDLVEACKILSKTISSYQRQ